MTIRWPTALLLATTICGCRTGDDMIRSEKTPPSPPGVWKARPNMREDGNASPSSHSDGPIRRASVTQFQAFGPDSGKPEANRLEGILDILRRELQDPGFPTMGLGGGPIDSGYVLKQGAFGLGLWISSTRLTSARNKETDPRVRELLVVALAVAREPSVVGEVRRIAQCHPLGSIRSLAIKGLQRLRDTGSREILLEALRDRYTGIAGLEGVGANAELRKVYPVRQEALLALQTIGEVPPTNTVVEVPLSRPSSRAALYAHLLEDKDPQSCLAGVQLLVEEGDKGRPYLEAFVTANAKEPSLKASLSVARRNLH